MGHWRIEAFVHAPAVRVAEALAEVVALDGYRPVSKPSAAACAAQADLRIYDNFTCSKLWGVVIIPGSTGWSQVRCKPDLLLCERPHGIQRPRLAELARRLHANVFQLNSSSNGSVMLECTADGDYPLSGTEHGALDELFKQYGKEGPPEGWDNAIITYFQEQIVDGQYDPSFKLLPHLTNWNTILVEPPHDACAKLGSHFAGVPLSSYEEWATDLLPFNTWSSGGVHDEPESLVPGAIELYFELVKKPRRTSPKRATR